MVGGSIKEDITRCLKVFRDRASTEEVLKCTHEEADGRIFFHVNDGIKRDNFTKIVVASPDTDVFVNAVYHFTQWTYCGLEELWILSGKSGGKQAFPAHDLVQTIDNNIIDVLPAVHALTGILFLQNLKF